ncbi:MAG TPA: DNA-deoxyinosine glycosylase [Methylophilaceae bacterium]|nr:DNA-deoxyinosine glycosylase [Methylophilaceae bacterium]
MDTSNIARVYSFPPIAAPHTRVLILGSMPGEKSLQMNQYYAHPQNVLWRIMGDLVGAGRELAYEERVAKLLETGIGLWEVLESCHRPGSLDSAINPQTMQSNDFNGFFAEHSQVTHVFFNGGLAADAYRRRVKPILSADYDYIRYERLPSTSPAHASRNYQQKLEAWRRVVEVLRG